MNTGHQLDSQGSFWYYAVHFFTFRLPFWIYAVLASMIFLPFMVTGNEKRLYHLLIIHSISYFLIISAGSKHLWYDAFLFPLFSMLTGLFMYHVYGFIKRKLVFSGKMNQISIFILFILVFSYPWYNAIEMINRKSEYPWDQETYQMGYLIRDPKFTKKLNEPVSVVFEGYSSHLLFYIKSDSCKNANTWLGFKFLKDIQKGDQVLISQSSVQDSIQKKFLYRIILESGVVKLIQIEDQKTAS